MVSKRLMMIVMLTAVMQVRAADERKQRTVNLLHALIDGASSQQIQNLVERGVDLNGHSSLFKQTLCHCAARKGRSDAIRILAAKGANVNAKDSVGNTPLHEACDWQRLDAVGALLECGANTQEKNNAGQTPLDIASEKGLQAIVNLIEEHENIPDIKEPEGN